MTIPPTSDHTRKYGRAGRLVKPGKTLTRSALVARLAARPNGLTAGDVAFVVELLLMAITNRLAGGGRVEIRGFGSFRRRLRRPRSAHNPGTGERILVGAKYVPCFKVGRDFRKGLAASFLAGKLASRETPGQAVPAGIEPRQPGEHA